jgi:hypothetical protein
MKDHLKDFDEFKNSEGPAPSAVITQNILSAVNRSLHPSAWRVFGKLSLIHCITAAFTLSICPQFGIRLLGEGLGLMSHFMRLGDYGCGIACGSFFMGTSIMVATLCLQPEEIRVLRKNQLLEFGALSLLSIGGFAMFHAEIVIWFAFTWLLGTVLGGSFTLEAVYFFRKKYLIFAY